MLGKNIITVQEGGKNEESVAEHNVVKSFCRPLSKGNGIERELSFLLRIMSSASQRSGIHSGTTGEKK